jgi:hypothetical protein
MTSALTGVAITNPDSLALIWSDITSSHANLKQITVTMASDEVVAPHYMPRAP